MERREPDNISIPLDHIHCMEFDARASMLIGSFLDMLEASLPSILSAAMEVEVMPEKARDVIQHALDFEKSRGQAVKHLLMIASVQDANLKLIR